MRPVNTTVINCCFPRTPKGKLVKHFKTRTDRQLQRLRRQELGSEVHGASLFAQLRLQQSAFASSAPLARLASFVRRETPPTTRPISAHS